MGACCSCKQVQLQPGKVHIKKIREIFNAYLKNQGIKISKKNTGKEFVDQEVAELVGRHASNVSKDLIQLMQIDQQFIKKVCAVLSKRILDYDQSTELQYLGLVLLKEIMQTPLNEREKREQRNVVGKQFKKLGNSVKKLKMINRLSDKGGSSKTGGPDAGSPPLGRQATAKSNAGASDLEAGGFPQAHTIEQVMQMRQPPKAGTKNNKVQIKGGGSTSNWQALAKTAFALNKGDHPNLQNFKAGQYSKYGGAIVGQEEYKLEDLQSKEYVFCVSNEALILTTINEVICFYNDDLNPAAVPAAKGAAGSLGPPAAAKKNQFQEGAAATSRNQLYFAQTCLEILNILIDNIQKSQLVESEETYFDLLSNFLYKSQEGTGIFEMFGLNPSFPYAQGLEPPGADNAGSGLHIDMLGSRNRINLKGQNQFNYNYLHNTSQQNVHKPEGEAGGGQAHGQGGPMQSVVESGERCSFSNQIKLQAYTGLFKMIKIMKESYFTNTFPQILEHIWCLVKLSKDRIEHLGQAKAQSGKLLNIDVLQETEEADQREAAEAKDFPIKDEYFEQSLQIGFDIFQYICVKISSESIIDQEEQLNLLMHGIFQYFNKKDQWHNYKFSEFVFILMIFNGGKTRLDGNIDFTDFSVLLQNYYENKMKMSGADAATQPQANNALANDLNLLDENMLDKIIENLLRVLTDDLFAKESQDQNQDLGRMLIQRSRGPGNQQTQPAIKAPVADDQFILSKINLMKVLFEMLSLVESRSTSAAALVLPQGNETSTQQTGQVGVSENPTFQKMVQDSGLFIQIFGDLQKFLACQSSSKISEVLIEQFREHATRLFEIYIFKVQGHQEILTKSFDFVMSRIQVINFELVANTDTERETTYILENQYLMVYAKVLLYFIEENVQQLFKQSWAENRGGYDQGLSFGLQGVQQQMSSVSPTIRKRMTVKNSKVNNQGGAAQACHSLQAQSVTSSSIQRLKNDYQIYMLQAVQVVCSTAANEALNDQVVLTALNIDLKLKNLNNFVKALQKQNIIKKTAAGGPGAVQLHSCQDTINFQSKPLMHYKQKHYQAIQKNEQIEGGTDSRSPRLACTDFRSEDKNLQMLLAQRCEIRQKDFLKIYLYSVKEFLFENLLGQALSAESAKVENTCILLLLENWLALVGGAPRHRPEAGSLNFLAFLLKFIDELGKFAIDAKNLKAPAAGIAGHASLAAEGGKQGIRSASLASAGGVPPPGSNVGRTLELQVKVKTLFVFMLYVFLNATCSGGTEQDGQHQQFPRLGEHLLHVQSKFEKNQMYFQIEDTMPSLPGSDRSPFAHASGRKNEANALGATGNLRGDSSSRYRKTKKLMDKNEKIDGNQQASPKTHVKVNSQLGAQMKPDSVDQISRKFDAMLRSEVRVLDQLISSDLYPMIEKERKTMQQLAQEDLEDLSLFTEKNPKSSKVDKFGNMYNKYQRETSVDINQAMDEIFYLDNMGISAKERIQILGFQALKTADGDVIPFKKIGNNNTNLEIEKDQAHLHKQLTHNLKSKVNPEIDLNRKFDIQIFENAMKNPANKASVHGLKQPFEPETSLEESQSQLFPKSQENTDRELGLDLNPGHNMISQESRVSLNSDRARSGGRPGAEADASQIPTLQQTKSQNVKMAKVELQPRHHVYREKAADEFGGIYVEQIEIGKVDHEPSLNLESCSSLSLSQSNIIIQVPADLDEARLSNAFRQGQPGGARKKGALGAGAAHLYY